jgi:hypothetical protein
MLRVVQQAADQRALAVVDAAAGEKRSSLLVLVLGQVGFDVDDQFGSIMVGGCFSRSGVSGASHQK